MYRKWKGLWYFYFIDIQLLSRWNWGWKKKKKKTKKKKKIHNSCQTWLDCWEYLKTFTWSIWYEIAADLGVLSLSIETVGYCQSVAAKNWNLMRQALTRIPSGYLSLKCHLHTRWKTFFSSGRFVLKPNRPCKLCLFFALKQLRGIIYIELHLREERGAERLSCPSSKGPFLKHHCNFFWRAVSRKL